MLPIVAASTVQFRRGGLLVAVLSAVLFVGLVLAQYLGAAGNLGVAVPLDLPADLPPVQRGAVHRRRSTCSASSPWRS